MITSRHWILLISAALMGCNPPPAQEFDRTTFEQVNAGTLVEDTVLRLPRATKDSFMIGRSTGFHHGSVDILTPDSLLSTAKHFRTRAAIDVTSVLLAYPDTIRAEVRRPVFRFVLDHTSEFIEVQTATDPIERRGWIRAVTQEIILDSRSRIEWSSALRNGCYSCSSKQRSEMDAFNHLVELCLTDSNAFRKGWSK